MRPILHILLSSGVLLGFAQSPLAYVSEFENGKSLDSKAWMISLENDTLSFSKYKGKWVLVDYWSVTCRPCIKELPAMNAFAQNHGIPNLSVIAISVDDNLDRWIKLSQRRAIDFPNYYAGRSTKNDLFGLNLSLIQDGDKTQLTTTLPRYSLIDPTGRIIERELTMKPSDPGFKAYIESLMD